jgi:hypothetical protein
MASLLPTLGVNTIGSLSLVMAMAPPIVSP